MNPNVRATGGQIAFLIFAVVLLAAPLNRYVLPLLGWPEGLASTASRVFVFAPAILILLAFRDLREACALELRIPIPKERYAEVGFAVGLHWLCAMAAVGAVVLYYWVPGGEMALARRLGHQQSAQAAWIQAFSPDGVLTLVLSAVVAPIVEELIFRGFLYRAWEAQWGWVWSMLATSTAFALFHPNFFSAFAGGIVLTCVLRRTGSLRACIVVHAAYNTGLWYPLLGQFLFRTAGRETGEIAYWTLHLAVLAFVLAVLPIYIWMARDEKAAASEPDTIIATARP